MPPAEPLWPQALARYLFAAALLPGWREHAADLPADYQAALIAFEPDRPLDERYQRLLASRAHVVQLTAAPDSAHDGEPKPEHASSADAPIAPSLLRIRLHLALGEHEFARQRTERLLRRLDADAATAAVETLLRAWPCLPISAAFETCAPAQTEGDGAKANAALERRHANGEHARVDVNAWRDWLSAQLLDTQAQLTRAQRHTEPKAALPLLVKRRQLPCAGIESERRLALTALRLGKKVTIKPESRLVTEGQNLHLWARLGESGITASSPAPTELPPTAGGYRWPQLSTPITAIDNSAGLLLDPECESLLAESPIYLIAFDPSRRIDSPDLYQARGDRELHSGVMLGIGKPHPQPVATLALGQLSGVERVDWLRLDARRDPLAVLADDTKPLRQLVLLTTEVVFQPSLPGQADLGQVSHCAKAHGLRFYCLYRPQYRSPLTRPADQALALPQQSELVSAEALFIPDAERWETLSNEDRIKLAFLVHQFYGLRDLSAALLALVDSDQSAAYLRTESTHPGIQEQATSEQTVQVKRATRTKTLSPTPSRQRSRSSVPTVSVDKPSIALPDSPRMSTAERHLLERSLQRAKHYYEFGAGGSTVLAVQQGLTVQGVESDPEWVNALKAKLGAACQTRVVDIGPTGDWGVPVSMNARALFPAYSQAILAHDTPFDFILVDGRFRVACTMTAIQHLLDKHPQPSEACIFIHDFWDRPNYHVVLQFLDVIEQVDTAGVFRLKPDIDRAQIDATWKAYAQQPS